MYTKLSVVLLAFCLAACSNLNLFSNKAVSSASTRPPQEVFDERSPQYRLGPGDSISVFVWRAPELSGGFGIRPDGRFTMPLIEDMVAVGRTPTELARDLEEKLSEYVHEPIVSVSVSGYGGRNKQGIRIMGQATNPQILPYFAGMTTLDILIAVGGLTAVADGNNAVLIRHADGTKKSYRLRLDDLARGGDYTADRPVLPGDIIIIPESWL